MKEATSMVKTIEITRAVRAAQLDGLSIKKKQAIGLLDGELLAAGKNTIDILNKMLAKMDMNQNEIVTVYYGADAKPDEASLVSESIREQYPQLQVEVVKGGQPYYDYIVSIE
jgi:dihydroxyacetone kinase-like predicted kinase